MPFDPGEALREAGAWYPPREWYKPGPEASRVMAAIAEGFCPRCLVSLGTVMCKGREIQWCSRCKNDWRLTEDGWEGTHHGIQSGGTTIWVACPYPEYAHIRIP